MKHILNLKYFPALQHQAKDQWQARHKNIAVSEVLGCFFHMLPLHTKPASTSHEQQFN